MARVLANGLEIEVADTGPRDAPAVLMIMGWACQLSLWQPSLVDGLGAKGYRVIRFDNRDCGLSTKITGAGVPDNPFDGAPAYTLDDMARDALGVLDALEVPMAHMVGASMGGAIAQILASRHGSRVRSLVSIMSSTGDGDLPGPDPEILPVLNAPPPDPADREACIQSAMAFWTAIQSPDYPAGEAELRYRAESQVDRQVCPEGSLRQYHALASYGSRSDLLKAIRVRSLVIHGGADRLVHPVSGSRTAEHIPDAELEIVPGLGHDFTDANAQVYLELVSDFLDRVQEKV